MDQADILSEGKEAEIAANLAKLEQKTRDQLVVVTTPDLKGETIEQFGLRLGNGWGVGQRELDNGVLLIVAPNERKVRIEVGCGLEALLTNDRASRIIENSLIPRLREGDYERAVKTGVADISTVLLSDRRRPARAAE